MGTEIIFPQQLEDHEESLITFWHVAEGDNIQQGEVLVEVQTEKTVTEIEAPVSGILKQILKERADVVKVGEVLAIIAPKEQTEVEVKVFEPSVEVKATPLVKKLAKDLGVDWTKITPSQSNGVLTSDDVHVYVNHQKSEGNSEQSSSNQPLKMTARPSVRKFAREKNVNLEEIETIDGFITKEDVLKHLNKTAKKQSLSVSQAEEVRRQPISATRKAIVKALTHAHTTIPQVTHFDEVNVSNIVSSREKLSAYFAEEQIKLTYLAYIMKAYALTLKRYPTLNASFDAQTDEIIYKDFYHIGIAVDSEKGLFVPVIQEADKKSLVDIAREIEQLAVKARAGRLSANELIDGTATVSNIGSVQGGFFTPIIQAPQASILGIGKVEKRAIVVQDEIQILPMMSLSLSYDHRIIDGVLAQQSLNQLKEFIQNPDLMFALN